MTIDINALLEEVTYTYTPTNEAYHFIVIGAGGTGGYLIPNLARMVSVQNKLRRIENRELHSITIVDKDDIEPKNLLRQQFVEPDVGKNKAKVMATRYGRGFGLSIAYKEEYMETPEQLDALIEQSGMKTPVLIDCVDNNKTRLLMNHVFKKQNRDLVYLSSGNEESAGQVVFSYKTSNQESPTYWDIFPNGSVDKLPTELSCAESAESAPQNIHTNLTAANILFGFLNKLLNGQKVQQLLIFFDIQTQNTSVYRGTYSDVVKMLSFVKDNAALKEFVAEDYLQNKNITLDNLTVVPPSWTEVTQGQLVHG